MLILIKVAAVKKISFIHIFKDMSNGGKVIFQRLVGVNVNNDRVLIKQMSGCSWRLVLEYINKLKIRSVRYVVIMFKRLLIMNFKISY